MTGDVPSNFRFGAQALTLLGCFPLVCAGQVGEERITREDPAGPQTRCEVTIHEVVMAKEYRGAGPTTPALEESLAKDPAFAESYRSMSHGDYHIQCHYDVSLSVIPGMRFHWREVYSNTLRELDPSICAERASQAADNILSTTRDCTDLDAGEYWGMQLVPLDAAASP